MKKLLFGITWAGIHNAWWFIPLMVSACILIMYRCYFRIHAARRLGVYTSAALMHYSPLKEYIKTVFIMIGLLALLCAALRPQWDRKEETVVQEGRDLFIALDVSRSMLAPDCAPDRLTCAKQKIKELVKALNSERVGLILFSGAAYVQCPLTADHSAFFMFLDAVDAETISSGTTALDLAIEKTLAAFAQTPSRKNKLLVLFTDGEDFSHNLSRIKSKASEQGLTIFAFGVGTTQGAPIPCLDERGNKIGHQKDEKGAIVISRLNEAMLTSLVHDTGGMYSALTNDTRDIHNVVRMVERFEKEKHDDKRVVQLQEQYHYFLLISLLCFALEWLL